MFIHILLKARSVIESLAREGKEIWMISGDNTATATAIGRQLGINNIMGGKNETINRKMKMQNQHYYYRRSPCCQSRQSEGITTNFRARRKEKNCCDGG